MERRVRTWRTLGALLVAALLGAPGPRGAEPSPPLAVTVARHLKARPLTGATVGLQIARLSDKKTILTHNGDLPLKPASNMKLVTAAAALAVLKPDFQFETTAWTATPPPPTGVVNGHLYVQGKGDPYLVMEEIWLLAQRLKEVGVASVTGDLVGDDAYFADQGRHPAWPAADHHRGFSVPIGALAGNFSGVTVFVYPTRAGRPATVAVSPFPDFLKWSGQVMTTARGTAVRVHKTRPGGGYHLAVSGRIAEGDEPDTTVRSVDEPTRFFLHGLRTTLGQVGVTVGGDLRRGPVPDGSHLLYTHQSRPLSQIVFGMNKHSSNFIAESLVKTLGAEVAGAPGNWEKGLGVLQAYLAGLGIETTGIRFSDGSGLSHHSRLTAAALTTALLEVTGDFDLFPEFLASLPIGGVDGTLEERMLDPAIARRVRAKTGRIRGVVALSGYLAADSGERYAFAILVNGIRPAHEKSVQDWIDDLCRLMVTQG